MAFVPPHPTRDQEWDPVWILTFSPLGPESPFRPGKPGGPCGREGGNKRGNEFMAHSFIHLKTHGIGCSGHTIGPGGPSGPGDPGRPCSPWKKKKCNSLIPSDSSAPSWEYSDYPPVPGNVCPGFSQMAKAKGFVFLPRSNLCWKRDFVGHGQSPMESG